MNRFDKMKLLQEELNEKIDFEKLFWSNLDDKSWRHEQGVLLSCNEAQIFLDLINKEIKNQS